MRNTDSILLFDEAEDLFTASLFDPPQSYSRVFFHRLLEQGGTPVIWTANDLDTLGPAIARRMALCIEVRQPGIGCAPACGRTWRARKSSPGRNRRGRSGPCHSAAPPSSATRCVPPIWRAGIRPWPA
ncbi:hypothetical protein RAA17_01235 [Komagataeibacter rhaeticus]|nr:hypothetical protein [Komagataeibacter rhaeticus]